MKMALIMTRTINIARNIYNDSNLPVTFNEILMLESIKSGYRTKTEIKNLLAKDAGAVSRSIDKLLERGLIKKEKSSFKYLLTKESREILKEVDVIRENIMKESFGDLSEEIAETLKNLEMLTDKLEKFY